MLTIDNLLFYLFSTAVDISMATG